MKRALLLIDLQECYLSKYKDQSLVTSVVESANKTLAEARELGLDILIVEHEFSGAVIKFIMKNFMNNMGVKGSADFKTDSRIELKGEETLIKNTGDSFKSSEILNWVKSRGVEEVIVIGQDGNACIKSTIEGALANNLKVSVIESATMAQNQEKWLRYSGSLQSKGLIGLVDHV
jgi:nicotinamidase-related amidase